MEDGYLSRGQRPRLTCTECYRRKTRCDKQIPCGTCTRRGFAEACTREEATIATAPQLNQSRAEPEISSNLVQALLHRVNQLEEKLKEQTVAGPENTNGEDVYDDLGDSPLPVHGDRTSARSNEAATTSATNNGDEATVLEFLAWGRQKDVVYGTAPKHGSGPKRAYLRQDNEHQGTSILFESSISTQLDVLESLLPSKTLITQLVEYHDKALCWYHCSYSPTIFKVELNEFQDDFGGDVRHEDLDLQWLAVLFAVLTGSLTCASQKVCRSWHISENERGSLAIKWYEATVTCLSMAQYTEVHSIHSIQAIATLTISAHILGKSNSQSVLLAAAGRISQSLGLHRLSSETENIGIDRLRRREAGRRVFHQLCTQDWFQIPFSESYSLNPRFLEASKPLNCNDDDMLVKPQSLPTQASYSNYRYEIASLMPQLLDAMHDCNTLYTKYEKVLQYDEQMRKLATAYMPTFLSTNAPVESSWPIYIGWARRSLAICAAHKIIMIHRKFLGLSFTNSAFSFTRRTCIAASKTILKEALSSNDEQGPVLWIEQAFSVAAGIVLSLDTLHRSASEKEYSEHMQLVTDAISYLSGLENNKIASRGVQLLSALQHQSKDRSHDDSRKRMRAAENNETMPSRKRARAFNMEEFITSVSESLGVTTPIAPVGDEIPTSGDGTWSSMLDMLPPQTGFGGQSLFDDILSFQF